MSRRIRPAWRLKQRWMQSVLAAAILNAPARLDAQLPSADLDAPPRRETYDAVQATLADVSTLEVWPHDWPQWGGSRFRNNTPFGKNIPLDWHIGEIDEETGEWNGETARNIKWVARLGSQAYGNPVVANGKIFIGTNNMAGYLKRYPPEVDLGVFLCFDEETGRFLWQHSNKKLPTGRVHDWPYQGVCSTPVADGDRVWYVSNRGEVVCLDALGFYDGENDGPVVDEFDAGFPDDEPHVADVIWRFSMMEKLGASPHNMSNCSMMTAEGRLFVCTSNGVDESHKFLPAPNAPSFIALDRDTGNVLWTDNSPGENILHSQWASPSYAVFRGQPQVIFPGGDGWLYSFDPAGDGEGRSKLLWKFDCNPKESVYSVLGDATRNTIIGFPVVYDGLVYIAVGEDPEHYQGPGHLWCIDPNRRGDISPELVVDEQANQVPHRRLQAVDASRGETVVYNPNSGVVWHYTGGDWNGNGVVDDFIEEMHRSMGTPAIKDDILYIADFSGLFHCLDAKTGMPYWTFDMLSETWGSPLVVDGKVYIADMDGDVSVFRHSTDLKRAMKIVDAAMLSEHSQTLDLFGVHYAPINADETGEVVNMRASICTTPIVANGVLYISTQRHLFAIANPEHEEEDE